VIEAQVEAHLVRRVKALGGETRKVIWPGRRGAPDRLVLLPGEALFVELKRPKHGRLEPHQLREHARLRASGFTVAVLSTPAEVDAALGLSA
jgi:hypothetical protein